jgi:hypothetical protein
MRGNTDTMEARTETPVVIDLDLLIDVRVRPENDVRN